MTAAAALERCTPDARGDRFEVSYLDVAPMAGAEGFAAYGAAWHRLIRPGLAVDGTVTQGV
jgi:hypothetical protein